MSESAETKGQEVGLEKLNARKELLEMEPFNLKRDVFFVHGWGDEACICWTDPYMETGANFVQGWGYTVKEWVEDKKLGRIKNKEKVHYVSLMGDEAKAKRWRDKTGKFKIDIDKDLSYFYENFFQFAELLKEKIRETKAEEFDIVAHSMGGLDSIALIAVDKEQDEKGFIKTEPLSGLNKLITVATPYRGSPKAGLLDAKIAKLIFHRSEYIKSQGKSMNPRSYFVKLVNEAKTREQLLNRIKELHMFGGEYDEVVQKPYCYLKTDSLSKGALNKINTYPVFKMAKHSQRMGITQDHRLILAVMNLLKK